MIIVKKTKFFRMNQNLSELVPERKLGFFVKIKEDENFNHRNTGRISRINPPEFGGGLKFESDADIGGKDSFRSGTS
jgi:hypothetical protein